MLGLPPARYPGLIRIVRGRRPHVCGGHRRPRPRPEFTEAARGYGSSDPICSFPTELPDQLERQDENCTHSTTQCDCSTRLNDHVQTQYHSPGECTSTKASKLRTANAQCAVRSAHCSSPGGRGEAAARTARRTALVHASCGEAAKKESRRRGIDAHEAGARDDRQWRILGEARVGRAAFTPPKLAIFGGANHTGVTAGRAQPHACEALALRRGHVRLNSACRLASAAAKYGGSQRP